MACLVTLVVAGLLLALAPDRALAGKWVRGARSDLLEQYKPNNGRFMCLEKSKTIDFARVNDNYCDCPDGSDEPGTSACPTGAFYCRNRGHEPKLLSAAFVDDGICDCCDGTDELSGCENTCIEQNAALRESLKKKVADYKQALDVRAGYVKQAADKRASMVARLGTIDTDISAKQGEVQQLEEEKERIAAEEAEKKAQEASKLSDAAEQPPTEGPLEGTPNTPAVGAEHGQEQQLEEHEKHGASLSDEPQEESAEERGRRIAAQWTNDPEAAGSTQSSPDVSSEAHGLGAHIPGFNSGTKRASWLSKTVNKVKSLLGAGEPDAGGDTFDYDDPGHPGFDHHGYEPSTLERTPVDAAADRVSAVQAQLTALHEEKARLQRQLTYDYGEDNAWLALVGECIEAREPQYSYRSCLFDSAAQVDNGAGHETNLGTWKGFEHNYSEAVFDEGDYCASAPRRGMRVKFECGLDNRSWGASEPSTCVYQAYASSPAACTQAELAQHEAALAAVLKGEEELRREIAAEAAEREQQGQPHDEL